MTDQLLGRDVDEQFRKEEQELDERIEERNHDLEAMRKGPLLQLITVPENMIPGLRLPGIG